MRSHGRGAWSGGQEGRVFGETMRSIKQKALPGRGAGERKVFQEEETA